MCARLAVHGAVRPATRPARKSAGTEAYEVLGRCRLPAPLLLSPEHCRDDCCGCEGDDELAHDVPLRLRAVRV
jgi:hypothetical protein